MTTVNNKSVKKYLEGDDVTFDVKRDEVRINPETGLVQNPETGQIGSLYVGGDPNGILKTIRDPRRPLPTSNILNPGVILGLIRRNLYDNLAPYGYNVPNAIKAVFGIRDPRIFTAPDGTPEYGPRDRFWATYLNIPVRDWHQNAEGTTYIADNGGSPFIELEEAEYRPTMGDSKDIKYYLIKNIPNSNWDSLFRSASVGPRGLPKIGENVSVHGYNRYRQHFSPLGTFVFGHGYDDKGEYYSAYDRYDLSPFNLYLRFLPGKHNIHGGGAEDQSFGIGRPFGVYNRLYLDDYYDLPEEYRGYSYVDPLGPTVIGEQPKRLRQYQDVTKWFGPYYLPSTKGKTQTNKTQPNNNKKP